MGAPLSPWLGCLPGGPWGSLGAVPGGGPGPMSAGQKSASPLDFRIVFYIDFDVDF